MPSGEELEGRCVAGPNDAEVPAIECRDLDKVQALGGRDDRGVDRTEWEVAVAGGELGDAQPVTGEDGFGPQRAGGEIAEEADLCDDAEPCCDEVGDFADDEDRDEQRTGVGLEELPALDVVAVVGIDVGVERAGIDQERDVPISSARISSMRSETS